MKKSNQKKTKDGSNADRIIPFYATYLIVILAYLAVSFFPDHRLWGVNWFGYWPIWLRACTLGLGIVILLIVSATARKIRREPFTDSKQSGSVYFVLSLIVVVTGGAAFYLARAQTHFLGDGYGLISLLGKNSPVMLQAREFGTSLLHIKTMQWLGGEGKEGARLAFQTVSIISGVLFLALSALLVRSLASGLLQRALLMLGVISGGYMLLFFGYVENYPPFFASVFVCCAVCLLIVNGRISRWYVPPALALTVFMHMIGVVLAPMAIYAFFLHTKLGSRIANMNGKTRALAIVIVVALGAATFLHFYFHYYFFRFAFLPPWPDQFTADGYTLFSVNHLLDMANLLLALVPGLPVLAVFLLKNRPSKFLRSSEGRLLAVFSVSALALVFVINPRLGVPRDWDLFAFAGLPVILFCVLAILRSGAQIRIQVAVIALASSLGLLTLGARAAAQIDVDASLSHVRNYQKLDRSRNRYLVGILRDFYLDRGDTSSAIAAVAYWRRNFPEVGLGDRAEQAMQEGNYPLAKSLSDQALEHDPCYWDGWTGLGGYYTLTGKYDSAITALSIALGFSPYNVHTLKALAVAYMYQEKFEIAEKYLLTALKYEPDNLNALGNLVKTYRGLEDTASYYQRLIEINARDDTPRDYIRMLAVYYAIGGDYERSEEVFKRALEKGLDSGYYKEVRKEFFPR